MKFLPPLSGTLAVIALIGLGYALSPIDLLPELLLGPIGLLDDLVVVGAALSRVINRVHPDIVNSHWSGRGDALDAIRRGNGNGMWGRRAAQRGKTCRVRDRCPQRLIGGRLDRGSEGPIVLVKPGNSGGGKGPYFWSASEGSPEGRLA